MNHKKIDKIIHEIYSELFKASTPSVSFDELVENATINERGQKEIPFMDYEIEEEKLDEIFNAAMKRHKVPKWMVNKFRFTIYLGCSPKTKRHETR